jgi:hypothetical protein
VTCCGQGEKIKMRQIHFKTELKEAKRLGNEGINEAKARRG